jgi:hypothetical protein
VGKLMGLITARRCHRHSPRRALLRAADGAAHALCHVLKLGIPAADVRQQVRRSAPLSQAGCARENQFVLPEFIPKLGDFQIPHSHTVRISS